MVATRARPTHVTFAIDIRDKEVRGPSDVMSLDDYRHTLNNDDHTHMFLQSYNSHSRNSLTPDGHVKALQSDVIALFAS